MGFDHGSIVCFDLPICCLPAKMACFDAVLMDALFQALMADHAATLVRSGSQQQRVRVLWWLANRILQPRTVHELLAFL